MQDHETQPPEAAAALVAAQFPGLAPVDAVFLNEGMDFRAFLVNGRYVFRFPKSAEADERLQPEIALLQRIATALPLPVPDYLFHGRPSSHYPHRFAGYRFLPGTPALYLPTNASSAAPRLAAFLNALHAFDPADIAGLGLAADPDGTAIGAHRAEALSRLDELRDALSPPVFDACRRALETPPADYNGLPCLVHNDLGAEHILLDDAGVPAAVIDWTDVILGDPARDFACLWPWLGDAGLDLVLGRYLRPIDSAFRARARYLGLCVALGDLHYGLAEARPPYRDQALRALCTLS